ncbi:Conserved_hypothetical protein [Hexamita inflata]|uniref:Uncharacterized protein n=1 Tax=Hexamita inflata TaxID=28002 RepID=A0AA86UM47_9EUKA|nr:Conserved hypothetical protein [Hexamita inflata]
MDTVLLQKQNVSDQLNAYTTTECTPEPAAIDIQKLERYNILSKRMSYWINIFRTIVMIQVMAFHYSYKVTKGYGQQAFCDIINVPKDKCTRSWLEILLPHPLVGYGSACTCFFFAMAGFFSQMKFEQLYEKHRDNTKKFLSQFVYQYVKRYMQMHAVLFVFGLGYGGFLYFVFGENGRDVYYNGPRMPGYWMAYYFPFYWPGRVLKYQDYVSGSSWFSLSLMNVEFVFYMVYLLSYFIRKQINPGFLYSLVYLAVLTTGLTLFYQLYKGDTDIDANLYYLGGLWLYWARKWYVDSKVGRKAIDFVYTKEGQITRIVLFTVLIYAWLVISRIEYHSGMAFILLPLLFDTLPAYEFKGLFKSFFKEMNRLGMAFYILHNPFIMTAMPKYFPAIMPKSLNGINSITTNWFVAWWYVLIFAGLSYPLWFMLQPFECCLDFFKNFKKNKDNKKKFWANISLSIISLSVTATLIVLVQTDTFGHDYVPPPETWHVLHTE